MRDRVLISIVSRVRDPGGGLRVIIIIILWLLLIIILKTSKFLNLLKTLHTNFLYQYNDIFIMTWNYEKTIIRNKN